MTDQTESKISRPEDEMDEVDRIMAEEPQPRWDTLEEMRAELKNFKLPPTIKGDFWQ